MPISSKNLKRTLFADKTSVITETKLTSQQFMTDILVNIGLSTKLVWVGKMKI